MMHLKHDGYVPNYALYTINLYTMYLCTMYLESESERALLPSVLAHTRDIPWD